MVLPSEYGCPVAHAAVQQGGQADEIGSQAHHRNGGPRVSCRPAALRFCRRALIAVPIVTAATTDDGVQQARMDEDSLANGIYWTRRKLVV